MSKAALTRMHGRLLLRLGEQAVLRELEPCIVNVERGVTVQFEVGDAKFYQSETAAVVDVAHMLSENNPAPGDRLSVDGVAYVIDAIVEDNGYMARCVLRKA